MTQLIISSLCRFETEFRRTLALSEKSQHTYPNVGILMVLSEIQHVVQSQHARRGLCEVHGGIDMILEGEKKMLSVNSLADVINHKEPEILLRTEIS